ncbi:hypothetical protein CDAR_437641 [Caerostris darwini]|uniref:Uncharacterized protein n=1 Tax=Caerostris darwini TaxID=1538125 RepID=A0AAV4NT51_9ARAC|nr:hypothetical protein CDAR_437641 [Caerostris darwini]
MAIYRNPSNHLRSQELPRSACDGGTGVPLPILDPLPRPFPNPRRKATEFLPLSLLTRSLGYKGQMMVSPVKLGHQTQQIVKVYS